MTQVPEEYEQDFSGLTEWVTADADCLETYFEAANLANVRLAYKTKNKAVLLFCEADQDMTGFWIKFKELKKI